MPGAAALTNGEPPPAGGALMGFRSAKSPEKDGSMRRMRSTMGGWVAKREVKALPKNICPVSAAAGDLILVPMENPPIFFKALAIPVGLRVN